jgi:hypothetical protein
MFIISVPACESGAGEELGSVSQSARGSGGGALR